MRRHIAAVAFSGILALAGSGDCQVANQVKPIAVVTNPGLAFASGLKTSSGTIDVAVQPTLTCTIKTYVGSPPREADACPTMTDPITGKTNRLGMVNKWFYAPALVWVPRPNAVKYIIQFSTDGSSWTPLQDATGNSVTLGQRELTETAKTGLFKIAAVRDTVLIRSQLVGSTMQTTTEKVQVIEESNVVKYHQ